MDAALVKQLQYKITNASNDSIKATYLMKLCTAYLYHNSDSTIQTAQRGLAILNKNQGSWIAPIQIQLILFIGHSYRLKGNFNAALSTFHEMLNVSQALNDSLLIAESYSNIATVYADQEQYDSTTIFDLKTLAIREQINSPKVAMSYNNLGLDYAKSKLPNMALLYYKKAVHHKKQNGQIHRLGNSYLNIGNIYQDLSKQDSALYFFELALDNALEGKDSLFIVEALHSVGLIHSYQHHPLTAKKYFTQAINIFDYLKTPYNASIIPTYQELAHSHITLGELEQAEVLLNQSHQILLDNNMAVSSEMKTNLEFMEHLYWAKKDFVKARAYSIQEAALVDTLHQRVIDQKVYKLLIDYNDQLKQKRIESLEQQQQISDLEYEKINQQRLLLGLTALVMLLIIFSLYRINKWRSKVNQELETINQTKDKLFSIIAHDLKNPLSAFRSITQSLSDDIFNISREDLKYFIQQLNRSAHNLFELLQNLLYWSISQSGRLEFTPTTIDLSTNIQEVINLLQNNASYKKISVTNEVPKGQKVFADPTMLRTIVRNLLTNAIKFTPEAGTVRIKVIPNQDDITISVQDTGIGIPPHLRANLFKIGTQATHQAPIEGKGTGLGLILCKELVERQGGKIWVESPSNQGSIFNFTLPIHS